MPVVEDPCVLPSCGKPTGEQDTPAESAQTVLLEDPDTGSTDIGIAQPVSIARVIPFDMGNLESPVDSIQRLFLQIRVGNEWGKAEVIRQTATGAVRLRCSDGTARLTHFERYMGTGLHEA